MTRPRYEDIRTIPLPTDRELIPHLQTMLETALRRQVWIMLLDAQACPLPILIPIDLEAEAHQDDAVGFADTLRCLSLDFERATLVLTFERPGPAEVMDRDRRWLRSLRDACANSGTSFRGPYLLLGNCVRQVPPDDYVGVPWAYPRDDEWDEQTHF